MQKAIALFLATLFISLTSLVLAQTEPDIIEYKLKIGDIITYEILHGSKKQIMKIKFTNVPDAHFDFAKLTFDWTKTVDNINQSGKVKFTGNYMDDYNLSVTSSFRIDFENIQYNKIFPSQGLWLGMKAQMAIVLSGSAFSIALLDDKEETRYTLREKVYYTNALYNGNPCHILNAVYKSAKDESSFLMVQESEANPLIMVAFIKEKDFLLKLISIEEGTLNTVAATPAVSAQPVNTTPSIPTVTIGSQTWMVNNLDVSKFRNGDIIPEAKSGEEWVKLSEQGKPAWRYYNEESAAKYGKLYNWYAVADPRGLAPEGWHVPTEAEWAQLINHLGGNQNAGSKLKTRAGWRENNGTNESGFGADAGGYVFNGWGGLCFELGRNGYFWSSTEKDSDRAWSLYMIDYETWAYPADYVKANGLSVRCVKNK